MFLKIHDEIFKKYFFKSRIFENKTLKNKKFMIYRRFFKNLSKKLTILEVIFFLKILFENNTIFSVIFLTTFLKNCTQFLSHNFLKMFKEILDS